MKKNVVTSLAALFALAVSFGIPTDLSAQKRSDDSKQPTVSQRPQENPVLIEDFNAAAGSFLIANGWTAHSGAGTNSPVTVSPSLTYTGYPSSGVGNATSLTTTGEDVNRTFAVQTAGTVYAAAMVNVTEAAVDPIGGYFFHLGPDPISTTFRGRLFIKKDATGAIAFGISKAASTVAADITYTPFVYALNTTYLIVIKYTIVAGATNDTVDLFINPTIATEPAPTISAPDVIATDINPGSVALRQGTAATHPTVKVDGIRVGTSWASITQPATFVEPFADFNGDGKTDWAITRNSGGSKTWWVQHNGAAGGLVAQFGIDTDIVIPVDFDGDSKADVSVWREAAAGQAAFYILQSTTNTVRIELFGQTGDRPTSVGDYDGDGKADPSVYRAAAGPGGQSYFYYRGSLNNPGRNVTYIPWGTSGDVQTSGDFDGDGKFDVCVFRNGGGGQGVFILRRSSDLGVEYVNWGVATDNIVPGDFDGDGKFDFAVARLSGGNYSLYILERDGGGTGATPIAFALEPDYAAFGDYDGDGKQDIAVWREGNPGVFWVRQSSNGAIVTFAFGQIGDNPVYEWNLTGGIN